MNNFKNFTGSRFNSFWWGGFECADHLNAFGNRIDMHALTGHIERIEEDYANLKQLGILTVREGISWYLTEKQPYSYDFSTAETILRTADKFGIQVIWDICHFGFPNDLTPLHPMFARRFSAAAFAFAEFLAQNKPNHTAYIVPINEVSFLSWLGGDARGTSPYTINSGWDVKYHLMKAYIEAVRQIKDHFPSIKILSSEPLIHIAPMDYRDAPAVLRAAAEHSNQYQTLDILTGRICPELGGHTDLLDIIGINFYFNNQWICETHEFIPWGNIPPNSHWKRLSELVTEVFLRYGKPIVITETGHPGEDRPQWLEMIHSEINKIFQNHLPLLGCCLYPIVDRPDWDFPEHWHHSGLWDIYDPNTLDRIPFSPILDKLNSIVPAAFQK